MTTKNTIDLEIAQRASALAWAVGVDYSILDASMDLEAAQKDTPLNLELLRNFKDGDFGHDVFGIRRHLNRRTGKLEDCFVPRCAAKFD